MPNFVSLAFLIVEIQTFKQTERVVIDSANDCGVWLALLPVTVTS